MGHLADTLAAAGHDVVCAASNLNRALPLIIGVRQEF
jgi:hypothetical protein